VGPFPPDPDDHLFGGVGSGIIVDGVVSLDFDLRPRESRD
jgi:hypothetical protein